MTALVHSFSSSTDLSSSSFPSLSTIAETTALGALDSAGRAVNALERGVDFAAQTVNSTLPAAGKFIGGFILPAHLNTIAGTVLDYGTWIATGLVAGGAKATAQTLTFGAPAWVETLREGYGVSAVATGLNKGDTSREFLARCFAESTSEPLIKDSLLSYLDLRKQLSALQQQPENDAAKISSISREIARFEIKLRDYQDFNSLKMILEKGDEFVVEQHKRINQLSRDTAESIVSRVEQYYQEKCGSFAGKIEGSWSAADTDEKRTALRSALTEKIALRLQNVFDREMSAEETLSQINQLAGDLHSSFGTYRNAFKSVLYTALGVGYATGAVQYLTDAAGSAIKGAAGRAVDWAQAQVSSTVQTISDGINAGMQGCYDYFHNLVTGAVNRIVENNPVISTLKQGATAISDATSTVSSAINQGTAVVSDAASSATSALGSATESVNESVSGFVGSSARDYSQPYWTGTNRVQMGYGPDGLPHYGVDCTSGWPSRPRFDPNGFDFRSFGQYFESPLPLGEMLKPNPDAKIDPEFAAELLEMLKQK